MTQGSILNEVMGPVMRGPSSSHTAAAHRLGVLSRALLGAVPLRTKVTFDPNGSYGRVYEQQGADLAFAAGLMRWPLTEERFFSALDVAEDEGLQIDFVLKNLPNADHPNSMIIELESESGKRLEIIALSIGGGVIEITSLGGWEIKYRGDSHLVAVETDSATAAEVAGILSRDDQCLTECEMVGEGDDALVLARRKAALAGEARAEVNGLGVKSIREATPVLFVESGEALFSSATELVEYAESNKLTLSQAALDYEAALLQVSGEDLLAEATRRVEVMRSSVEHGMEKAPPEMLLLEPSAGNVLEAEREDRLAMGGLHTRAAARAMAAMHVNSGMGVVCAAPTGGAAGVLPGVIYTLMEERELDPEGAAMFLLAAGVIGLILYKRATFAAEIAGCQVEIGAAAAMAAAAVVDWAGGSVQQATDAAAISFQNTMGSVCDLVQGAVEIPCHTRNAVGASSAFVCADLVMGGYQNPVPLDETIDAVFAVGKMLPPELRCTALGGIAVTPSALALQQRR